MSKKISWQILIDLADKEVDQSVEALAGAVNTQEEAENKLTMLEKFYDDYLVAHSRSARNGLTAEEMKNQQLFMERLNAAITQQKKYVTTCALRAEGRRTEWQGSYMKLKSYGVLSKRLETQEAKQAVKQEQRLLDEFSTRKFSVNINSNISNKD
ncbi:MAG: flagellar export protein FliJ [Thiobacillaceae bacterium]|jgi:flagellar FliJ protein